MSLNLARKTRAEKKYKMLPLYREWTFAEIMKETSKEVVTFPPYDATVPDDDSFSDCPIMSIDGPLRVNTIWANNGVRLSAAWQ